MPKSSALLASCCIAFAFALTACGGDGDTPVNTAEGLWQGQSSTGANMTVVVLDNGEAWGGTTSGNILVGALAGTATGSGTTFTASGSSFNFVSNRVTAGTYTGTVSERQRIQARSNDGSSIDLAYDPYYDQAVSAADIAGSYTLSGRTARYAIAGLNFTVAADGGFTIVDNGCTTTGSATPRSAGHPVVNVRASGRGTCALGDGVDLSGIALLDKSTTPHTLYVMALNSAKSDGLVLIGRKN